MLMDDDSQKVRCNKDDLLLALFAAFYAGHDGPYDLMEDEISHVFNVLQERVAERSKEKSLKKSISKVDKNIVSAAAPLGTFNGIRIAEKRFLPDVRCPKCHRHNVHKFGYKEEAAFVGIACYDCGWVSNFREMLQIFHRLNE